MRSFTHIARLIRQKRKEHPQCFSQLELSHKMGYKNGQFISNVERALCNIPFKMLIKIAFILNINPRELKEKVLEDYATTLDNYLYSSKLQEKSSHEHLQKVSNIL